MKKLNTGGLLLLATVISHLPEAEPGTAAPKVADLLGVPEVTYFKVNGVSHFDVFDKSGKPKDYFAPQLIKSAALNFKKSFSEVAEVALSADSYSVTEIRRSDVLSDLLGFDGNYPYDGVFYSSTEEEIVVSVEDTATYTPDAGRYSKEEFISKFSSRVIEM